MFSWSHMRHGASPALVADIEGGSIATAIVVRGKKKETRVVAAGRTFFPIQDQKVSATPTISPTQVFEAVKKVLDTYTKSTSFENFGPVGNVHAIMGASFSKSRTTHYRELFPKPTTITGAAIQSAAEKALKTPSDLGKNTLESNVIRVQLNEYATGKPIGQKARTLTVTTFESDVDKAAQEATVHGLEMLLPGRTVTMRSHMRALISALHEGLVDDRNCLMIVMESETTHCVAVRKDELTEHFQLPIGTATILRSAAGKSGLPEELFTLIKMASGDSCSVPACDDIKAGLARLEPELVKSFGEAFAILSKIRRLPNTCVLSVHSDFAPWLEHFFTRLDFAQFTATTKPFSVVAFSPSHSLRSVTWGSELIPDTRLSINAAFVHAMP